MGSKFQDGVERLDHLPGSQVFTGVDTFGRLTKLCVLGTQSESCISANFKTSNKQGGESQTLQFFDSKGLITRVCFVGANDVQQQTPSGEWNRIEPPRKTSSLQQQPPSSSHHQHLTTEFHSVEVEEKLATSPIARHSVKTNEQDPAILDDNREGRYQERGVYEQTRVQNEPEISHGLPEHGAGDTMEVSDVDVGVNNTLGSVPGWIERGHDSVDPPGSIMHPRPKLMRVSESGRFQGMRQPRQMDSVRFDRDDAVSMHEGQDPVHYSIPHNYAHISPGLLDRQHSRVVDSHQEMPSVQYSRGFTVRPDIQDIRRAIITLHNSTGPVHAGGQGGCVSGRHFPEHEQYPYGQRMPVNRPQRSLRGPPGTVTVLPHRSPYMLDPTIALGTPLAHAVGQPVGSMYLPRSQSEVYMPIQHPVRQPQVSMMQSEVTRMHGVGPSMQSSFSTGMQPVRGQVVTEPSAFHSSVDYGSERMRSQHEIGQIDRHLSNVEIPVHHQRHFPATQGSVWDPPHHPEQVAVNQSVGLDSQMYYGGNASPRVHHRGEMHVSHSIQQSSENRERSPMVQALIQRCSGSISAQSVSVSARPSVLTANLSGSETSPWRFVGQHDQVLKPGVVEMWEEDRVIPPSGVAVEGQMDSPVEQQQDGIAMEGVGKGPGVYEERMSDIETSGVVDDCMEERETVPNVGHGQAVDGSHKTDVMYNAGVIEQMDSEGVRDLTDSEGIAGGNLDACDQLDDVDAPLDYGNGCMGTRMCIVGLKAGENGKSECYAETEFVLQQDGSIVCAIGKDGCVGSSLVCCIKNGDMESGKVWNPRDMFSEELVEVPVVMELGYLNGQNQTDSEPIPDQIVERDNRGGQRSCQYEWAVSGDITAGSDEAGLLEEATIDPGTEDGMSDDEPMHNEGPDDGDQSDWQEAEIPVVVQCNPDSLPQMEGLVSIPVQEAEDDLDALPQVTSPPMPIIRQCTQLDTTIVCSIKDGLLPPDTVYLSNPVFNGGRPTVCSMVGHDHSDSATLCLVGGEPDDSGGCGQQDGLGMLQSDMVCIPVVSDNRLDSDRWGERVVEA